VTPATALGNVNEQQQDYLRSLLKKEKFSIMALDDAVFFTFNRKIIHSTNASR